MHTANDWILLLVLGGLCGLLGQVVRAIVGLKKLNDGVSAKTAVTPQGAPAATFSDAFDTSKLVISLLIGFVAGALAAIPLATDDPWKPDSKTILILVAAGYGGADFIEGFISRYLPK